MKGVIVVIGAGSIGQAIARRVSAGKHVRDDALAKRSGKRRQRGDEHRRNPRDVYPGGKVDA